MLPHGEQQHFPVEPGHSESLLQLFIHGEGKTQSIIGHSLPAAGRSETSDNQNEEPFNLMLCMYITGQLQKCTSKLANYLITCKFYCTYRCIGSKLTRICYFHHDLCQINLNSQYAPY